MIGKIMKMNEKDYELLRKQFRNYIWTHTDMFASWTFGVICGFIGGLIFSAL